MRVWLQFLKVAVPALPEITHSLPSAASLMTLTLYISSFVRVYSILPGCHPLSADRQMALTLNLAASNRKRETWIHYSNYPPFPPPTHTLTSQCDSREFALLPLHTCTFLERKQIIRRKNDHIMFCSSLTLIRIHPLSLFIFYLIAYLLIASL